MATYNEVSALLGGQALPTTHLVGAKELGMSGPSFHGSVSGHNVIAGNTVMAGGTLNLHTNSASSPSCPRATKPCRVMPFTRNEDLIDRVDIFAKLEALLPSTDEYHSAALWGLGGSGKTQIALEYAYRRCRDPACSVFWAHADNETTFAQDYKTIAKKLRLDSSLDGEELLEAVREAIEAQPQWLLVLDNADNLELFGVGEVSIETPNLVSYIPNGPAGTVLWTSRDKQVGGALVSPRRTLQITHMLEEEAKTLLQVARDSKATEDELGDVTSLLMELQWLPLAISQAGAYMRRTLMPIKLYLSRLLEAKKRWSLLQQTQVDRHRRPGISNSILETWSISIDLIQQESQVAYHILLTLAYLDNQNITLGLISTIAGFYYNTHEQDSAEKDGQLEISIARLNELSFLKAHVLDGCERTFEMHKLVQEAIRYNLNVKKIQGMNTNTAAPKIGHGEETCGTRQTELLEDDRRNKEESYFSGAAVQIILQIFPEGGRETWAQCEKILAHAVRVGDWAEICGKEVEVSDLLLRVSSYLYNSGRMREIEQVEVRALELRSKIFGNKSPMIFRVMENLSQLYDRQGQFEKSLQISLEVLALRREIQGERHPDTIWAMGNTAKSYYQKGEYEKAMEMQIKILGLQQEILGERHRDTIHTMAHLAQSYMKQGQDKRAGEMQTRVLDLQKEILGEKHLETASAMSSLAKTYITQGQLGKSEEMLLQVLKLRQELLGEQHPKTLECMSDLTVLYYYQGLYHKAEEIDCEILRLRKKILGERDPDTITTIRSLGLTYLKQGRYQKAEELQSRAFELRREVFGEQHPKTLDCMSELATLYRTLGQFEKSQVIGLRTLELRKKVLGEKHPDTISSMNELAATYHKRGLYEKSEGLDIRTVELRKEVLGAKHPSTVDSMCNLAITYKLQDKYEMAEDLYMQALELRRGIFGEKHPNTIGTMVSLCRVYYYQGLYDKALCTEALTLYIEVLGEQHPETLQAMYYLGTAWHKLGHRDEAIASMEKCWLGRRAVLGDEHSKTLKSKEILELWRIEGGCEGLNLS